MLYSSEVLLPYNNIVISCNLSMSKRGKSEKNIVL